MTISNAIRAASVLAGAVGALGPYYARALEKARDVEARTAYILRERPLAHHIAKSVAGFSLGGWTERYPVAARDIGEDAAVFIVDHLLAHATDSRDAMFSALELWWAEDMARRDGVER